MLSDFKFALRSLRSTPVFTAVALIVLTLGIGATTAIYSVVDAVALKGLPFEQSDRLMVVDALPFYGMLFGPQATPDAVRPVVEQMRESLVSGKTPPQVPPRHLGR